MDLVHMLDAICKHKRKLEEAEEARQQAEYIHGYEKFLAELTFTVGDLIKTNFRQPVPDESFTSKGFKYHISVDCPYVNELLAERVGSKDGGPTRQSFNKFKDAWSKSGIIVAVRRDDDGNLYLIFTARQR